MTPATTTVIFFLLASISFVACAEDAEGAALAACPVKYAGQSKPLLFGGVIDATCKRSNGQSCTRVAKWERECSNDPKEVRFPVCTEKQFALGLNLAKDLHGGAPLAFSPCDLWPYLRGRTLWLIGDSHSKQLYRALQCFLIDFWPGQAECAVSASRGDVARLDDLPTRPGETKCFNVLGGGRVCQVHNVLGDSLLDNKNVSDGGVLPMLRRRFADPRDIFLVQFAAWHNKLGPPGIERMRAALKKLGEEYAVSGAKWPHLIYRESPMTHDKDAKQCLPAAPGWTYDNATGRISTAGAPRASRTALLSRGGYLNAHAHDILPKYNVSIMGGFSYSVPLHAAHIGLRGVPELDCLHYCQAGLPELLVYELYRTLKRGAAGVAPLPLSATTKQRPCPRV